MKSYTDNGYKNINFMSFGESQSYLHNLRIGCVLAVINPKLMRANVEHGVTFCVDTEAQFMLIGYS